VAAEIAQGGIARRLVAFFEEHDFLLCPLFDVNQRYVAERGGVRFDGYMGC
jgi:hypothetical protein